jgi:TetR/AcrR family tetracycline transcriptional repressor
VDRPKLSRELILDAAVDLLDKDGVGALTMRRLGAAIGVEAMTLYYYVPNKRALLDGIVERVGGQAFVRPPGPPERWPEWLRAFAVDLRAELLRHPGVLPLVAARPVTTPDAMRWVELVAAALVKTGMSPQKAFQVLNIVTTFVIGHTLAEAGADAEGAEADVDGMVAGLDPAEFPVFAAAIAAGLGTPADHEARFTLALDALFTGLTEAMRTYLRHRG